MGCTELPVAVREAQTGSLLLVDSSLELARASVAWGMARGWNKPTWDC
jgi:aspartate racemase